jgi:hypothetical protein
MQSLVSFHFPDLEFGLNLGYSGGLGLTGDFTDVTSLYDCLMAIQNGLTTDKILDKYIEIRIKKWAEIIDPVSRANFQRL